MIQNPFPHKKYSLPSPGFPTMRVRAAGQMHFLETSFGWFGKKIHTRNFRVFVIGDFTGMPTTTRLLSGEKLVNFYDDGGTKINMRLAKILTDLCRDTRRKSNEEIEAESIKQAIQESAGGS